MIVETGIFCQGLPVILKDTGALAIDTVFRIMKIEYRISNNEYRIMNNEYRIMIRMIIKP